MHPWPPTTKPDLGFTLSITLHDVAPPTLAHCQALVAEIERLAPLQLTLLVVPHYHGHSGDAAFDNWLQSRLQCGDELALHGLTHRDDGPPPQQWLDHARRRWYTDSEGEFAAIGVADATRRLNAGRRWFARREWPLQGFVAPAWLLSAGAWRALLQQPFTYTCTRTSLLALDQQRAAQPPQPPQPSCSVQPPPHRNSSAHMLHAGRRTQMQYESSAQTLPALPAHSIVYSTRAAWRRALSRPWNALLARREQHRRWMRFELHPGDVEHRAVRESALGLVAAALKQGREPLTLGAMAQRLRDSSAPR